jgi:sugar transferase (PEP-CTERM/EpsH1 system associated)
MAKPKILYLCHRIPYPPNKGDKIRSFNLLKELAKTYDVYLGCFIDDPFDRQYREKLADFCVEFCAPELPKLWSKIKGLTAFLRGMPITLPYYSNNQLANWVEQTIEQHQIDTVLVFSSSMAQYVDNPKYQAMCRVIDFVDVDSDKWRQYAEKQKGIMSWVFNREHRLLERYEQHYCQQFNHSLFVSPDEAAMFRTLMPSALASKIKPLLNGVDVVFFDPKNTLGEPEIELNDDFIVFTGAMDYWANVDAVVWFCDEVWPLIQAKAPALKFLIVGGNPDAKVRELANRPNVTVTGRVHDVRPYIQSAKVVVAPLRIARGIQNKVLEAMSMDKPIVASAMAMEGINAPTSTCLAQTDEAAPFAAAVLAMLDVAPTVDSRQWVIDHFTWQATLAPLPQLLCK